MKVGDYVHASNNIHHVNGRIVYGFSPTIGEFTDEEGAVIDQHEIIAIAMADSERVRVNGGTWNTGPWDSAVVIAA